MAAAEVQTLSLSPSDRSTLDKVLRPHLRLEPFQENGTDVQLDASVSSQQSLEVLGVTNKKVLGKRSSSQPAQSKTVRQFSRPTVGQNTIESDNKRRPIVLRRNASKYDPPSPEPTDPNSEAKSATIRRMQSNLEEWNQQLQEICDKKTETDGAVQTELENRKSEIKVLTEKHSTETKLRTKAEKHRDQLKTKLKNTEEKLLEHEQQLEHVQSDLAQYEAAYTDLDTRRMELEQELEGTTDQLNQSEAMRRRLNDQVTELQGQLAIEEQRSKICTLL